MHPGHNGLGPCTRLHVSALQLMWRPPAPAAIHGAGDGGDRCRVDCTCARLKVSALAVSHTYSVCSPFSKPAVPQVWRRARQHGGAQRTAGLQPCKAAHSRFRLSNGLKCLLYFHHLPNQAPTSLLTAPSSRKPPKAAGGPLRRALDSPAADTGRLRSRQAMALKAGAARLL